MRLSGFGSFIYKVGCICLLISWYQSGQAQLYPGMEGEPLVDAIRTDYTPSVLLNEDQAKDTLYARVFLLQDSVRCMYSDFARYLPDGVDPSQWLFNNGSGVESMNLEHGWPRSKGAGDGDGNTNMYHLFPTRSAINSDRAAHPFGEINDNQTQKWYYKSVTMSSVPSSDRFLYSEYLNGAFEPREAVKGDVARAMFYFWSIYRNDAMAADPFFFDSQRDDLCLWHQMDPVDDIELARNAIIAQYQGGLDNPFIIDCSLVMRAYCTELDDCNSVSVVPPNGSDAVIRHLSTHQLQIDDEQQRNWYVQVFDVVGNSVSSSRVQSNQPGAYLNVPAGIYVVVAISDKYTLTSKIFIP